MKLILKLHIFLIFLILLKSFIKAHYTKHQLQKRSAIDPSHYKSNLWIKWCIENSDVSKINSNNIKIALDMIEYSSCLIFIFIKECPDNFNSQLIIFEDDTTNNITSFDFDPDQTSILLPYKMKIDANCNEKPGCIIKKLLLYLGFILTHRRPDRNTFINVNTSNIDSNYLDQFNIVEHAIYDDIKYDYGSIMHILNTYMSNNTEKVFTIDQEGYESMVGQEYWLSFTDIKLLNKRYCSNHCNSIKDSYTISCKNGGILSSFTCNSCICPNMFASDLYCSGLEKSDSFCPEEILNAAHYEQILTFRLKKTCNTKIVAKPGKRIRINVLKAHLPSNDPCFERMGLEIKYRVDKSVTGLCLCSLVDNLEIESEDETVFVQYNGKLINHMAYITYEEM